MSELPPAVVQALLLERISGIAADISEIKDHLKTLNGRVRKVEDAQLVMETRHSEVQRDATTTAQKWGAAVAAIVATLAAILKSIWS